MPESTARNYPNIAQSFGITGIVILGMLVLSPVYLVLSKSIGKEASMFIYYPLSMGIPFWIVYSIRKNKTDSHGFNLTIENKRTIPFVIVGTLALLFGIIMPIVNLMPMPESIKKIHLDLGGETGFAVMLTVIAAPILEELIFRGIILDGLLKKYSPIKSILISSFLFGFFHLNPWQFVTGLIMGIFSGWVYYRSKSLLLSIMIHASSNLSAGFFMRYFIEYSSVNETFFDTLLQVYGGWTNLILVCVGSIIIVSICIYFLQNEFNKQNEIATNNTPI